jgi:hypothetical protein
MSEAILKAGANLGKTVQSGMRGSDKLVLYPSRAIIEHFAKIKTVVAILSDDMGWILIREKKPEDGVCETFELPRPRDRNPRIHIPIRRPLKLIGDADTCAPRCETKFDKEENGYWFRLLNGVKIVEEKQAIFTAEIDGHRVMHIQAENIFQAEELARKAWQYVKPWDGRSLENFRLATPREREEYWERLETEGFPDKIRGLNKVKVLLDDE